MSGSRPTRRTFADLQGRLSALLPASQPERRTAPSPWFSGREKRQPAPVASLAESRRLLRRALSHVRPHGGRIVVLALLASVVAAVGVAEPLLLRELVDGLTVGDARRAITVGIVGLLAAEVLRAALGGWMNVVTWRVRLGIDYALRAQVVEKLHRLPVGWHQQSSVGALVLKVNQSIPALATAVADVLAALSGLVYFMLALVAMLRLDWRLTALVLAVAPLPVLIGLWAAHEQTARERELNDLWHRLYGRFGEVMSGILTVKACGQETREQQRFLAGVIEGNRAVARGVATDSRTTGLRSIAGGLARIGALGVGALLVLRGQISLGTLMAFVGYVGGLVGPIQQVTAMLQLARRTTVPLATVFEILDADEAVSDRPDAVALSRLRGELALESVGFAYRPGRPVLSDVSFTASPGETVAIVGPSGSGKTTLVALLQRLHPPTSGRVLLDGHDLATLALDSVRRHLAMVPQDAFLFNDTIAANIAYARPDATREEIEEAARLANAHEFIRMMPERYDTMVGERGSRLSGGQRQRVAIARALLQRPALLLLDEPTSALDARSEALVTEALDRLRAGRTTLVIAHRLRTVASADRIVVLREGRMAGVGTHDELLASDSYYADLVAREFAPSVLRRVS